MEFHLYRALRPASTMLVEVVGEGRSLVAPFVEYDEPPFPELFRDLAWRHTQAATGPLRFILAAWADRPWRVAVASHEKKLRLDPDQGELTFKETITPGEWVSGSPTFRKTMWPRVRG